MERIYLEDIVEAKKKRLEHVTVAFSELLKQVDRVRQRPSFYEAMVKKKLSIIGEIKKASPSKGIIRDIFDPLHLADVYQDAVDAISVLTEEDYFMGSDRYLEQVSLRVDIPVLCKDFIIDPYQIYKAKVLGASGVLLITALLTDEQLKDYIALVHQLEMDALVEVHTREEINQAVQSGAKIIGINNRDLKTFKTDIQTTLALRHDIPKSTVVISESGIHTDEDIQKLREADIQGVLIGESFMKAQNIKNKVIELRDAYEM